MPLRNSTASLWDQEKPPQDFFSKETEVAGRQAAKSLRPGEVITRDNTRIYIPGMAGKVSPDKRAITVKVDEASGVAGFLTPESRVDVVVVLDKGEFNKNPTAKTILQNLKVLGTGQKTVKSPEDKPQIVPTVTMEVTPEQGELLALAAVEGRISLVLRGQRPEETPGEEASTVKPAVPGTTALLSPNQRAVTVKVDTASGVTPGKRVDVVLLLNNGDWAKYPLAKILFQNLEVLGTDQKQRVTFAVTPQEGLDLTWASQVGSLSLVLRGQGDQLPVKTLGASAGRFLGNPGLPAPRTVEVLRGVEMGAEVPLGNKNRPASAPVFTIAR